MLYGLKGRVISGAALIVIIVGALQAGGAFEILPPKITTALVIIAGVATAFAERIQGGASKPQVRAAASASDARRAAEKH